MVVLAPGWGAATRLAHACAEGQHCLALVLASGVERRTSRARGCRSLWSFSHQGIDGRASTPAGRHGMHAPAHMYMDMYYMYMLHVACCMLHVACACASRLRALHDTPLPWSPLVWLRPARVSCVGILSRVHHEPRSAIGNSFRDRRCSCGDGMARGALRRVFWCEPRSLSLPRVGSCDRCSPLVVRDPFLFPIPTLTMSHRPRQCP